MRNPNRLDAVYKAIHQVHKEAFPDMRTGQFFSNFLGWCVGSGRCSDIWFPEDNNWSKWVYEFANETSPLKHYDI